MKYSEALQQEEWKIKRLEILERDNKKCTECGSNKNLEIHHTFYYRQKTLPWNYPNDGLKTLCKKCHTAYHDTHSHLIIDKTTKIEIDKINWTKYHKDAYSFLSLNGQIFIGNYRFKNCDSIIKFSRCILSSLPINKKIFDENIVHFVHSLYKFHPNYNEQMIFENYIYVKLNEEFAAKYTNFVIVFEDKSEHNFSNKKCVKNI